MNKKILIFFIIISLVSTTSCMNISKKKPMKIEQKEKAPKDLASVMEGLDDILISVGRIQKTLKLSPTDFESIQMVKENKGKKTDEKESKNEGSNDEETQDKAQEKQKTEKSKESKPPTKDEELIKEWEDIDSKVEKVHKDWNNYEVEGMKKGINSEKGKDFKNSLNLLTRSVENKNIASVVDNGSKAMLHLAPFFDIYKDEINGDLLRVEYAAYQSYLSFQGGNIKNAEKLLTNTEEYITRIRQKLDKDKEKTKTLDQLSLSITDMKQSLKDKSNKVLEIKRDIILENIKSLEK